jgi:alpha-tubulin suppressor-like RCC1 family protein
MRRYSACLCLCLALGCVERGEVLKPEANRGVDSEAGTGGTGAVSGSTGMAGLPAVGGSAGAPTPSAVLALVSLGTAHGTAISANRLFAWGMNQSGELGQGDTVERHTPTLVPGNIQFSTVAGGGNSEEDGFTCALDEVGAAYCWGANARGQLGQGDRTERHSPVRVPLPVAARSITSDFEHVCALLADASLYCWGRNQEGELGQDDRSPPSNDETARDALEPVQVPGTDWSFVDTGDGHTCGIRFDGALWCWGRNTQHQLGPSTEGQIRHPIQVGTDTDWLRVDSGQQSAVALKQDHSLWVWGTNVASGSEQGYPLGLDADELTTPTRLGTATNWLAISTRVFHSCAVNRAEELWCWGRNIEGQLGTGDTTIRKQPTLVATGVTDVDVSWFMTCALTRGGGLECTGGNEHGQLGTGDTERPLRFTDITPPSL